MFFFKFLKRILTVKGFLTHDIKSRNRKPLSRERVEDLELFSPSPHYSPLRMINVDHDKSFDR